MTNYLAKRPKMKNDMKWALGPFFLVFYFWSRDQFFVTKNWSRDQK